MTQPALSLLNKHIAVVGLGDSGIAVARFCAAHGAHVIALDEKPATALAQAVQTLTPLGIHLQLGDLSTETLLQSQLVIVSPGVPLTKPALQAAQRAGIPMTGELEFASRWIHAPVVGITGTNGKSTVTSLCGAIAMNTGRPSFCGGNLGPPLIEAVGTPAAQPDGIVVAEMSSFQLETADTLHCRAAALLNLTADHLDRHHSFQAYGDAKARIANNQTAQDVLVVNADDPEVLALMARTHPQRPLLGFSIQPPDSLSANPQLTYAGWVQDEHLVLHIPGHAAERYPLAEFRLMGRHNQANALAAALLMRASNLAMYEHVRQALATFQPLPHRMQWVGTYRDVEYYDDSKGTNVDAVVASLEGFPKPFVLIAGGRDKGGSYKPLGEMLDRNLVRGVVLIGEAAPLIAQEIPWHIPSYTMPTLPEAVQKATQLCKPGDAVVLSPACSSFDMFRNYAHRAEVFCQAVNDLAHGEVS